MIEKATQEIRKGVLLRFQGVLDASTERELYELLGQTMSDHSELEVVTAQLGAVREAINLRLKIRNGEAS